MMTPRKDLSKHVPKEVFALPEEHQNIYLTLHNWCAYAIQVNIATCPDYMPYANLKKLCDKDWCSDFNTSLRALVDLGMVVVDAEGCNDNPRLTIDNNTKQLIKK